MGRGGIYLILREVPRDWGVAREYYVCWFVGKWARWDLRLG